MAATYIVGDLAGSNETAGYTVSFFGIGNVLTLPLALPMKNRFGIRISLNVCMIVFLISTFFSAFSLNYPMFLIMRFLQGVGSGPIFILLTALVSNIATSEQKDFYFRDVLMTFIIAPTLAASLGGFLAYELHWTSIFYLDTALIAIVAMLLSKQLTADDTPKSRESFDFIGYVLFIGGVLPLSLFLILGQQLDWFRSSLCFSLFSIGLCSLILFIYWTWNHPNPILKLRLLSNFRIAFSVIYLALLFSLYFGMLLLISLWLNLYVNYTVTWVSIGIGSMSLSAFAMIFVIRGTHHRKSLFYLALSIIFLWMSSVYTSQFNEHVDFARIAISRIIAGFGIALFLPPLFQLMVSACPEQDRLKAITLFQFTRALSSSLGAAFYITLWQRRFYFYYDRLGSKLTQYSDQTLEYFRKASELNLSKAVAESELGNLLIRQSRSLALNDCFYLMGGILVVLLIGLVLRLIYEMKSSWSYE